MSRLEYSPFGAPSRRGPVPPGGGAEQRDTMKTDTKKEARAGGDAFKGTPADDGWRPPPESEPVKPSRKPLWNNFVTMGGLYVVVMAILTLLTFGLFTIVSPNANPYVDIVGYLVVPVLLLSGIALIPIGILFKSWRLRWRDPAQRLEFRFPHVDLNDPDQRRAAKVVVGGTFALLPIVGVSSYHGYHYTDSAEFCSKACHAVMEPQATTYENSPHARVACAECHIGEGASWFVKSKLSGTRQVLAVLRDTFSRPIPPAIHHLRPARETCEHCHWPKKFFGAQLREISHFAADETNTRRDIDMLLNTGGGDETTGRAQGIHLHMALAGRIEYLATDEQLQEIPWVRYTDEAGHAWIYRSDGRPSSDPIPEGQVRQLDCMDCHNRPAHNFRSPQEAVDISLDVGRIDTTLPFIKREAVAALVEPYPDVETAEREIGAHLLDFYQTNYPELWEARKASVNLAVDRVREIYRRNFFPAMKVTWTTYPDNIGHKESPGCFRCHEGRHVDQRGKRISHECNACHTFLNPVAPNGKTGVIHEGEFIHPYKLEGAHAQLRCSKCHTGGVSPAPSCTGCHADTVAFRDGKLPVFESFAVGADPMAGGVSCDGCHDLSQPTTVAAINPKCMECHDDDEERFGGMLAAWKDEIGKLMDEAGRKVGDERRGLLDTLRRVGPLHNVEATRKITKTLIESSAPADATASTEPGS